MAFKKETKAEMLASYETWVGKSQAIFVLEYTKMSMKDIDALRVKVRDAGGQLHVVKNTLMSIALKHKGIESKELTGTCMFGFALNDIPALAKTLSDATKNSDIFKLKGGYLGSRQITAENVKSLADMPPLPVMRARLLGMLNGPASKLVRTLAEPARGLAAVVKAYSEQAPAAA